ncbi:MAG: InlB B-repeat-containing protein [Candidatus Cloacimonetes bacterium]|nr:InlB B-repeat-containing protein [Candidatus Cloacimonadota bacterium]MDY0368173.1 PKD domain-containing protein [Candidatus Syntrophosphaera sp.]
MSDLKQELIASGASAAVISLFILSMLGSAGIAFAADVPPDAEIADQGEFWSLTIHMMFNGADAESVEWDFGDDSPVSTEWNPSHTYAAPGDYIVTQTVRNSYNGGSTATGYFLLHVMGNPYVEYVMPAGAPAMDRVYVETHGTAVRPADPVWEGHSFLGWFADAELTVPLVWPENMTAPLTAYASWSDVEVVTHTLTIRGPDGTTVNTITVSDGATAVKPTAPEGKTVTYYTDEGLTNEYNWNTTITSDLTIYRKVVDATLDPEPESEKKVTVNGTEIVIVVVALVIGVAAVASRSVGLSVITLILIALAAVGILDIIDIPEIINGFGGVRL